MTSLAPQSSFDGVLTASQEDYLYGDLRDFNILGWSMSELDVTNQNSINQKFPNVPIFSNCDATVAAVDPLVASPIDNKAALQSAIASYQQTGQFQHLEHLSITKVEQEQQLSQNHQLQELQLKKQEEQQHQQQNDQGQIQHQQVTMYQSIPLVQPPILGKEEFPGIYNFRLILNSQESGKQWTYSEKLSKVFINMEQVLPLQFKWTPPEDGLWLRCTLVFKLDQYRSEPVQRCFNHQATSESSNRGVNEKDLKHVVRCLNAASIYETGPTGHLSVLTPLGTPLPGMTNVPVDYKFFCKNSCTHGMSRRATEMVFTLENDRNETLGRTKLEIRICSCPKRDKDKEELDSAPAGTIVHKIKKRKGVFQNQKGIPPYKKKITCDNQVFDLNLQIVGHDNYLAVMKYASDVMAGSALKSGMIDLYKPYIDNVQNMLKQKME